MSQWRAPVVIILLSLLLACGGPASTPVASAKRASHQHCGYDLRQHVVCAELEHIELTSPTRGPLDFRLLACESTESAVFAAWLPVAPPGPARAIVVRFRDLDDGEPLVPIAIEPVVSEWPCGEECEREELNARVPVAAQCDAKASLGRRELTLPAATEASCDGVALRYGLAPDFCREPLAPGVTVYRVRSRGAFTDFRYEARFELRDGEFLARVSLKERGKPAVDGVVEAEAWREALERVWALPKDVTEGCRDGGLETVTARRGGAWRVVVRRCTRVLDLRRLVVTTARTGGAP